MAQIVVGGTVIKAIIEWTDLVSQTAIEQVISQDSAVGDVIQSVAVSVVDSARQPLPDILLNRESDAVIVRNSTVRQLVHKGDARVGCSLRQAAEPTECIQVRVDEEFVVTPVSDVVG